MHSTNPCLFYLVHAPRGLALLLASQPEAASHLRGNRQSSDPFSAILLALNTSPAFPAPGKFILLALVSHRDKPTFSTAAGSSNNHKTQYETVCALMGQSPSVKEKVEGGTPAGSMGPGHRSAKTHLLEPWGQGLGPAQRLPSVPDPALLPAWAASGEERHSRASHPAQERN